MKNTNADALEWLAKKCAVYDRPRPGYGCFEIFLPSDREFLMGDEFIAAVKLQMKVDP